MTTSTKKLSETFDALCGKIEEWRDPYYGVSDETFARFYATEIEPIKGQFLQALEPSSVVAQIEVQTMRELRRLINNKRARAKTFLETHPDDERVKGQLQAWHSMLELVNKRRKASLKILRSTKQEESKP